MKYFSPTMFVLMKCQTKYNLNAIEDIKTKYPEPPLDGPPYVQNTAGVAADPTSAPTDELIDNSRSLDGTWTEFIKFPSDATKEKVPSGIFHVAKHGRIKCNWKMNNTMLNSCPDKDECLRILSREGRNLCPAVFANQRSFVTLMTSCDGQG